MVTNLRAGPPVAGPRRGVRCRDRRRVQEGPTVREYSVPATVRVGDRENLVDAVFDTADEHGSTVVYRRRGADGGWYDVTAAEFADQVTAVAQGLIAAGVGAGDRVALLSRTRYEWTLFDYAILAAGRGHRADLRDVLGRADRVDPVRLRRGRGGRRVGRARGGGGGGGGRRRAAAADLADRAAGRRAEHPGGGRAAGRAGLGHRARRGARPARARSGPTTWPRSSTPPAPPAGRRAASSPTATCSARSRRSPWSCPSC